MSYCEWREKYREPFSAESLAQAAWNAALEEVLHQVPKTMENAVLGHWINQELDVPAPPTCPTCGSNNRADRKTIELSRTMMKINWGPCRDAWHSEPQGK